MSRYHAKECSCHECNSGKQKRHEEHCNDNQWVREQLECLRDTRVVFFAKSGIHVEGTVRRVGKKFIEVVTSTAVPANEQVEVESNASGTLLETFTKFFLRIDDIVGFGQETTED